MRAPSAHRRPRPAIAAALCALALCAVALPASAQVAPPVSFPPPVTPPPPAPVVVPQPVRPPVVSLPPSVYRPPAAPNRPPATTTRPAPPAPSLGTPAPGQAPAGTGGRPPPTRTAPPPDFAGAPLPPRRFGSFEEPAPLAGGGFDPDEVVDREIVATLLPGLDAAAATALASQNDLSVLESAGLSLLDGLVVRLRIDDDRPLDVVVAALSGDGRVAYAGPNRVFRSQGGGAQYALERLGLAAPDAPAGEGVRIAVIDTRPDTSHPELAPAGIRVETLLEGEEDAALDHGTQIVGLIAAADRLRGAARAADILAIAAFTVDPDGRSVSTGYRLLAALDIAAREGARVINMSFAGGADPLLARGLDALAARDVVLVAAAGNGGPDAAPAFPGSHPDVIAVTATDAVDDLYAQANRGDYVDLAAPGVDLLTPAIHGRYALGSGTSLAAAYVTAAAALAVELRPDATAEEIRAALASSARDLGPAGRDPAFGWGLATPPAALDALASGARLVAQ